MTRIKAVLLMAVILIISDTALAQTSVWDGSMVRISQGSGTQEDPFLINKAEELAYLIRNYDYNEGIFYRKYYKITSDLDMKSTQWTFGSATSDRKSFRAHINGDGHKISNIEVTLKDSQGECHYGLFPQLGGDADFESVIENLEVENIHFVRSTGDATGTYNFRIGGLVGKMYSHSRITNCLVHGFTVTDYGTEVNLHPASKISACPLVGEVLDNFGQEEMFYESASIHIEHSYGHGSADLSHFHGAPSQFHHVSTQGPVPYKGYSYNNYMWYKIGEEDYSFSMMNVSVMPASNGEKFQYEGIFNRDRTHTYTYFWELDGEKIGTKKTTVVTVEPKPYTQRLSLTVMDNGVKAGSGAILIEPDMFKIILEDKKGKRGADIVSAKMVSESGIEILENDFDFVWKDMMDSGKVVSNTNQLTNAKAGHSYLLLATHTQNKSAKFSIVKSYANPIFVCNRGISTQESDQYTIDGKTYRQGNDANDGLSPEKAVRTLKRAYQLLKPANKGGEIGNNIIVIMGDYGDYDFTEFMDSKCTQQNPHYFVKDRPALITGSYDNLRNGRLLFAGLSIKMSADTRFEQINLSGSSFEISDIPNQTKVYANGHNLTMGYGIFISGYKIMDYTLGLDEGVLAPAITLYGGVLNNNDPDYISKDNTLQILSGTYGRIIAGDGYTLQMDRTGNISGSPMHPVRTRVVCDASNYYNPYHTQYDAALVIGGQADGTLFADTKIEVKGTSRIGRIVGGNVAFGRAVAGRPADSFFGHTDVTVTGGEVTEIYGTNFGRYGHILYASETEHDSCMTYFYGKSELNILGGTVFNTIYGGGAACVSGFGYDANHHTEDPYVPYWKDGRVGSKIIFGRYKDAVGKLPIVMLRDSTSVDLSHTELHVNVGGDARLMGSLYGGSVSFSPLLPTHQAGTQCGNIYADTYINMEGGTLDGYIFGGCRGNLSYFDNSDHSDFPIVNGVQMDKLFFSKMAQMFGNAHVTVTGGEVKGVIYGGGEGTYYRATAINNTLNAVDMIGTTYGNTELNIGGDAILNDYIIGAGNYAHVLRTGDEESPEKSGNVEINIGGGKMYAAVFGGGHGNKNRIDALCIYPKVSGDVHVNIRGGEFVYNPKKARYIDRRVYGVLCGGIETSIVRGNTYLNMEANPFPDELKFNPNVNPDNDLILCCGGYDEACTVVGKASLTVNTKDSPRIDRIYMGGIYGKVGYTEANVISGKVDRIYGTGQHNGLAKQDITITVGTEDEALNETISIDNIFSGLELEKTNIKIHGGNVLNILRAE